MIPESCATFSRMRHGFLVEVNNLQMDEKFPVSIAISSEIPADTIAIEKLIEWFYINLEELMNDDLPVVRGSNLTVAELGDLVCSAWNQDEYPFMIELESKFQLIKIDNIND